MIWFEEEVRELERDRITHVNGTRPPVFYGSSSIRMWSTLAADFDPRILNLGFGGSTMEACDHFFERLVVPVTPRSLTLYAGDNDLADGRTVEATFTSYRSIFSKFDKLPGSNPFLYISVKLSPARLPLIDRIQLLNKLVRNEINTQKNSYFVDVFSLMLDDSNRPRKELFQADGLHLSQRGYQLWAQALEPYRNQIFTL